MRLEDWFKYLEQQYVDEQAQKEEKKPPTQQPPRAESPQSAPTSQTQVSAEPVSSKPPTSGVTVPQAQVPKREEPKEASSLMPPLSKQVEIDEVSLPDPADYIFTLRRVASEPTPVQETLPAEQPETPEPIAAETSATAETTVLAEELPEETVTESPEESVAAPIVEETRYETVSEEFERPARAKSTRRAPYARSVRPVPPPQSIEELWKRVPKHVRLLVELGDDGVTQKYYDRQFRESRQELVEKLLNPSLTLEDTARLLGVCPTTVRRYTERGLLNHYRTPGNQRRFHLSDVIAFLEARQQAQEARRRKR